MLFQGQEFAASAPFHYFADHKPELARAGPPRAGRVPRASSAAWRTPETQALLADPVGPADLRALQARPRPSGSAHAGGLRPAPGPAAAAAGGPGLPRRSGRAAWTGPCWGAQAFVLRFFGGRRGRRPAAAGQPRPGPPPRPGPGAAAGPARRQAVGGALVERRPALRRQRDGPAGHRGRTGGSPARRPWSWSLRTTRPRW